MIAYINVADDRSTLSWTSHVIKSWASVPTLPLNTWNNHEIVVLLSALLNSRHRALAVESTLCERVSRSQWWRPRYSDTVQAWTHLCAVLRFCTLKQGI